jgi:Family of unknown function (DUF6790)
MIYYLLVLVVGATCVHLWLGKRPISVGKIVEVLLRYLLVIFIGIGGLVGFMGHTFMAREIALKIGWQPSPFQFEVAMTNLAFGVLGILCLWLRRGFWTATGLGSAIFLLGCAYGHLREMIFHSNYAPYNVGVILWVNDIALPLIILLLLFLRWRLTSTRSETPASET